MSNDFKYNDYIESVLNGSKVSSLKIIQACKRHREDIKKSNKKDYPYYFDDDWAQKYITFIKLMRLHKGKWAGQLIPVQPFQEFIVALTQGWRRKEDNKRRFTEIYIQVAKKNAKTTFAAALIVAQFYVEPESSGQYVFAASTRKQANICYTMAKKLVSDLCKDHESIADITQIFANSIVHKERGSYLQSVSKEAGNVEGLGASCVIIDEYHVHKTDELKDNLRSGQMDVQDPLMITITTPGYSINGVCHNKYEYCLKVLDGIIDDPTLAVTIFEIDKDDDWKDISIYEKANPNIGESPRLETILNERQIAINTGGSKQQGFITKHCGRWVSSTSVWIPDDRYMQQLKKDPVYTGPGYGGLDLAMINDMAAYARYYPESQNFKIQYFMPAKKLEGMEDYFDYRPHVDNGLITITGEEKNDYDLIEKYILDTWFDEGMECMYFDPYSATKLSNNLFDHGLNVKKYAQTFGNMSPPISQFELLVAENKIFHDGNPVTRWGFSNVQIIKNSSGYRKISKSLERKKVDGPVALVMAIACETMENTSKPQTSKIRAYDKNGNLITLPN